MSGAGLSSSNAQLSGVIHADSTGTHNALCAKPSRRKRWMREAVMGIVVFKSVREALDAGYHIYGRTGDGYLARCRTELGWALALIVISR